MFSSCSVILANALREPGDARSQLRCHFSACPLRAGLGVATAVCLAMAVWLARAAVEAGLAPQEAGLAPQEAGGGLVDGVIALEGQWLGGYTFIS